MIASRGRLCTHVGSLNYPRSGLFCYKHASQRIHPQNEPTKSNRWLATKISTDISSKPFYITTPIFYVNASPHVGHLYTMVIADTFKRWRVLLGNTDAQMLTGTDEHGMKIQRAAHAAGVNTQRFCDINCETFKKLAEAANLNHDYFIRTTDESHKVAVRYFWEMLNNRGYIYTSKHEGWYSVSDETFYPESGVRSALDPATGRKLMVSEETGKEVEWSSETNYHFRLSEFGDRLLRCYEKDINITPKEYRQDIIRSVKTGLQDLSISRPVDRLQWGIKVPGDDSQTIYVWLDALINYLTKAGYPFPPGEGCKGGWPVDIHVIGKDISRFHAVYWPAFLMALDLPLPRNILVHGHWTMNREKMSKSSGNGVNPFFAIERFSVDTMRFSLIYRAPEGQDSDYDNEYIIRDYKKILQWGLGNLASRLIGLSTKRGKDISFYITAAASGDLPPKTVEDQEHQALLAEIPCQVADHMNQLSPKLALHKIVSLIQKTNEYFHAAAPWDSRKRSERVMYNCCESARIAGILLQPFIPEKSSQLLDVLGVDTALEARNFAAASYGADQSYGQGTRLSRMEPIFPPMLVDS